MNSMINLISARALSLMIAAGAGGLVLLGWMGAHAPHLDALAAFRWHAGALFGLALAAAAWPNRALAIACVAPLVILGVPLGLALRPASAPSVAAHPAPDRTGARKTLRMVTFNTWDHVRNIDEVHAMLRAADADVVVLVEVSPPKRALLEVLKPLYPYQVHCAAFWPCSMALVSRLPFEAHGAVLPSMTMPAAVWGRISGDGDGLTVIGVHIHRPTRSPRIHWGHMRGLAELTAKAKGAVIVAGDFNTPAWSASMVWLRRTTGLQTMPRILPTWPAWPISIPQFPIDHILVSRDLRLKHGATGPAAGSDHRPVFGTVFATHVLRPALPIVAVPPRPPSVVPR